MVSAVSLSRLPLNPGETLAQCLSRTKSEKPDDPWLMTLKIDPVINPLSTRVVVHTSDPIRPGSERVALKGYIRAMEPAMEMHQSLYAGGKIRIDLLSPDSGILPEASLGDRLLTKREFKKLRLDLKAMLATIGVKQFDVTLYSSSLNGKIYNLVKVRGDFVYSHLPQLRIIHEKYKPRFGTEAYQKIIDENGFFADLRFTFRSVNPDTRRPRATKALLRGINDINAVNAQMDLFLRAKSDCIADWRNVRMSSLDDKKTFRPEDISFVRTNSNGTITLFMASPFLLANPVTGSTSRYFETGIDTLAIGIVTTVSPEKRTSVGKAGLVVVKETEKISWNKADQILKSLSTGEEYDARPAEVESVLKLRLATQISATRSLIIGSAARNIFVERKNRPELDVSASEMVSELMVSNQRALGVYLAAKGVPVMVKRSKPNYSALLKEFKNVFADKASGLISLLGGPKEGKLFQMLREIGRPDLIREAAYCKIAAQCVKTVPLVVASSVSQLHELDKAPFKPRHGSVPALVNQMQLAALCIGTPPFSHEELIQMVKIINTDKVAAQKITEQRNVILKKAIISDLLFSAEMAW